MLELKAVKKNFGDVEALKGINLKVQETEFFGLLGPNGAGKTTAINLMTGYYQPDEGEIIFRNKNINEYGMEYKFKMGLCPQSIALYEDLNAEENLRIFGSFYNMNSEELKDTIKENLNSVGLYERRKDAVKNYSGGMKRRLNLAAALLHKPEILLCDEPTVGVDPQSRNAIFEYLMKLNEEGMMIIYTTHYMEEAERMCKRIAVIDNGLIIAIGTLDELLDMLEKEEIIYMRDVPVIAERIEEFGKFGNVLSENGKFKIRIRTEFKFSEFFKFLENEKIDVKNIDIKKPDLEMLFLNLTGRRLRD